MVAIRSSFVTDLRPTRVQRRLVLRCLPIPAANWGTLWPGDAQCVS